MKNKRRLIQENSELRFFIDSYCSSSKIQFIKGEGKRWGLSAPKPLTRAVTALDPYLRMMADGEGKRKRSLRHCASGPAAESGQPGCKASGESQEKPGGENLFSPPGFFRLFGPEASNYRNSGATGGGCWVSPTARFRLSESRGRSPLARGSGAAEAPDSSTLSAIAGHARHNHARQREFTKKRRVRKR